MSASTQLPQENPFLFFDKSWNWKLVTREEFTSKYRERMKELIKEAGRSVNADNSTATKEANTMKAECEKCFNFWESRNEKSPRRTPGVGKSWIVWEAHRTLKAPPSTSINFLINHDLKQELAEVMSLQNPDVLVHQGPEQQLEVKEAKRGSALFIQDVNNRDLGHFAMCPVNAMASEDEKYSVKMRYVKGAFKCREETVDKCGIDLGKAPEGYTLDVARSKKREDRDYFTMETKEHGTLERIHLYGSRVTSEKQDHAFERSRVEAHDVIYYIGAPGSVFAAQSDDKVIHFAPANKSRRIVLIFDKTEFSVAELGKNTEYVKDYWEVPSTKRLRNLDGKRPKDSEWIHFL